MSANRNNWYQIFAVILLITLFVGEIIAFEEFDLNFISYILILIINMIPVSIVFGIGEIIKLQNRQIEILESINNVNNLTTNNHCSAENHETEASSELLDELEAKMNIISKK